MSVYTKKGDRGQTSLYDSKNSQTKRVPKTALRIHAIGAIDELNSYLGIVCTFADQKTYQKLIAIQRTLFTINAGLAGAKIKVPPKAAKDLEKDIDQMEASLPVLKNFILPGGSKLASHLHFTRTLTRRAERTLVAVGREEKVDPESLKFLNRLSDYFFTLARQKNKEKRKKEVTWSGDDR